MIIMIIKNNHDITATTKTVTTYNNTNADNTNNDRNNGNDKSLHFPLYIVTTFRRKNRQ